MQERRGAKERDARPEAPGGTAVPRRRDFHIPPISVGVANRKLLTFPL